jgi:hypothetical protein
MCKLSGHVIIKCKNLVKVLFLKKGIQTLPKYDTIVSVFLNFHMFDLD